MLKGRYGQDTLNWVLIALGILFSMTSILLSSLSPVFIRNAVHAFHSCFRAGADKDFFKEYTGKAKGAECFYGLHI